MKRATLTSSPPNPKSKVTRQADLGEAVSSVPNRSGCWVEGHGESESLKFADVVADLALGVGAGVVVAGAEVDEVDVLIGEQLPDDGQDGAADRDDGSLLAAAVGDPPVALAEEGVGASGGDGGLAEYPGQVAVAVPGAGAALRPAGGLAHSGGEVGPGGQVCRGREAGHVRAGRATRGRTL